MHWQQETTKRPQRQTRQRWWFCFGLGACIAACVGSNIAIAQTTNAAEQATADVAERVREHLKQAALQRWPQATVDVQLTLVSDRLRLSTCTDLQIKARGNRPYGRLPVSLRCTAPTAWQLFVQAEVEVELPVVIATQSVPRGQILTTSDLHYAPRKLRELRQHFVINLEQAVGYLSSRPLSTEAVVYSTSLTRPITVPKGQRVAISGGQGPIRIAAQGEALEAGMRGDQIKVRNVQSGRELYAWVVGPGRVARHWPNPES